jgi:predicted secreted protein
LLKPEYFGDRAITEGKSVVEMRLPQRAEDAGVVPVSINAKIPQTTARYIERLYVFVDKNPKPLTGGTVTAEMTDSKGQHFVREFEVDGALAVVDR